MLDKAVEVDQATIEETKCLFATVCLQFLPN